jgi:hypothetical protein
LRLRRFSFRLRLDACSFRRLLMSGTKAAKLGDQWVSRVRNSSLSGPITQNLIGGSTVERDLLAQAPKERFAGRLSLRKFALGSRLSTNRLSRALRCSLLGSLPLRYRFGCARLGLLDGAKLRKVRREHTWINAALTSQYLEIGGAAARSSLHLSSRALDRLN